MTLPPSLELLVAGGDEQLRPDGQTRVNRYGCGAAPDAGVAAFGSSTASPPSLAALAAADALRGRLDSATERQPAAVLALEAGASLAGLDRVIDRAQTALDRTAALALSARPREAHTA